MKKSLISIIFLFVFCNLFAELVVVSNNEKTYVIEKNNIISIEPIVQENMFYSKRQGKVIHIYGYRQNEIATGFRNGNLTPVKSQTKIRFKNEANTQVSVAGAAVIGGGDASNKYDGNFIILDISIDEVIEKLSIKK